MRKDEGAIRYHRGGWELSWYEDGRRRYARHAAPNTRAGRRSAEAELDRLRTTPGTGNETVADLIELHRAARWSKWSPSTRASWQSHHKRIVADLGHHTAASLTPAMIDRCYAHWIDSGTSAATVRRRHTILSAAMIRGEKLGIIAHAPTRRVDLPGDPDTAPRDLPDIATTLAGIATIASPPWLPVAATLTVATGMRRGELCALRWRDVHLDDTDEGPHVRVMASIATGPDGQTARKGTKHARQYTAVAIDPGTAETLDRWQTACRADATRLGVRWHRSWPVIGRRTDPRQAMPPDRITTAWARHRDAATLPGVRWHDLRHIHATALVAAGVDPRTVAARLGHDPALMLRRYAAATRVADRAAADVIDAARQR